MPLCEVIYVRHEMGSGWKWRPVTVDDNPKACEKACEETYELFYECVTAARASGYTPNLKCL
jgi:hypothetical protein